MHIGYRVKMLEPLRLMSTVGERVLGRGRGIIAEKAATEGQRIQIIRDGQGIEKKRSFVVSSSNDSSLIERPALV